MSTLSAEMPVADFVNQMNEKYADLHKKFEDNFWATKMDLKGNSVDELTRTKNEYNAFISDKSIFGMVKHHLENPDLTEREKKCLAIMEKTYKCYLQTSDEADKARQEVTSLEGNLAKDRNKMKLGYTDPKTGEFKEASSVQLSTMMSTNDDEATRKACYEGILSIPKFVAEPFCEVIKTRNKMAKANGYGDFYEYKIQTTEGMDKKRLFEILDDLESKTRPTLEKALKTLVEEKGEAARQPWNRGYMLAGDVLKKMDPYFPFDEAVSAWARSFAAMNISYNKSTMNLDLCDRKNKYSNGFCHWPVAPYIKPDGTSVPCVTNFTSLAQPGAVGSGQRALTTLMHEGGHAAHFANVAQPSPFHSQERAPMSVGYAEAQSMFLDSLVGDSDWIAKYALSKEGNPMPWDVIEQKIKQTHSYRVFGIRGMLAVPYFEKALYELPDDEVTAENILRIADEMDNRILGGPSSRPVLAVPHILADESSCYYQGYILAEMAVHQNRSHFLKKYGFLTDNEHIGPDLREAYWKAGSSEPFLNLVEKFTGTPLSADAMVEAISKPLNDRLERQKALYEKGLKEGAKFKATDDFMSILDMQIRLVHGDLVVATTEKNTFPECCDQYKEWIKGLNKDDK
eukprot:TRINITY_DN1912_c0_g1_i1.p1 TRINITY_DN1912_c0_g1~~TRINITY_DN1912_c0_g1_i1.p1  ORF type:complete len:649 (+),score=138.63 TRINITY_DN1912_c0_g1_i1:68-1948(+)